MRTWAKVVLSVVALVILAGIVLFAWAWRNPMTLYVWNSRRTLDAARFERATVTASGGDVHFWSAGQGPPLVFLHGAGDQAGAWSAVVRTFTDDYRVLVPDLPGHGESDPATGPLPMTRIVEGLEAWLDATAPDEPAVVVGNSLGAWTACVLAYRRPGRVARVVAVNGGPLRWEAPGLTLTPQTREEARKLMEALRDPGRPAVPDNVLDDIVEWSRDGAIPRLYAAFDDLESHLLDGKTDALTVPVDVVWGASDRLIPPDYARRLHELLPTSRLTWIPDCGHAPELECPGAFVDVLDEVLDRGAPEASPIEPDAADAADPAEARP